MILLLVATTAAAEVRFLSPQEGGQVFGPSAIEISTDAANIDRVEFYVDGVMAGVARKAPYRIAFDFGASPQSRTVSAKVWRNGYRDSESATVRTAALTAGESMNVDLVEVPIRVRSAGRLQAADLRISENGVPQRVREVLPERGAAHFAFVVDRSLSMGSGKLEAALRAVDEARKLMRAGDSASLILFNHHVSRPRELGSRGAAPLAAETIASGGTSLGDAVSSIPARGRTYAIIISDGSDRNSALSEEAALRRISGTRTIVAGLLLGSGNRFLEKAAANTGGLLLRSSAGDLSADARRLMEDINSRYVAVYQSTNSRSGWRSITLSSPRGLTILAARKGYFAE